MGSFFTSSQILNYEQLSKEKFIKKFCDKMKEEGYVSCDPNDGELSYVLAFRENSNWVTINSDSYEQGNEKSESDTSRIARMLHTTCINTVVIDSDCAVLNLYDNKGNKSDTLIMGRADDYFGDYIPAADKKVWEPLIGEEHTWDQLIAVQQGDYVFVEEGLSKLAELLNMNNKNILFEAEEAADDGSNVFLSFKNARTAITVLQNGKSVEVKPKKITLNAAFKQVFGEKLAPLGFIRIKSKGSAFGRLINGEILQVVMIVPRKDRDYCSYMIGGGIATVYRGAIDLSVSPEFLLHNWITITSCYYKDSYPMDYNFQNECIIGEQTVPENASNEEIIKTLQMSYEYFTKWMLPSFDKVNSLTDTAAFFLRYMPWLVSFKKEALKKGTIFDSNESIILARIKDENELFCKYEEQLKEHNEFYLNIGKPDSQFDILQKIEKLRQTISVLKGDEKYFIKGEENKRTNMDVLRSLGYEI